MVHEQFRIDGLSFSRVSNEESDIITKHARRRPVARAALAIIEARRECLYLACSYTLHMWALQVVGPDYLSLRGYGVYGIQFHKPCLDCGLPTRGWCESCQRGLCTLCDDVWGGVCTECHTGLSFVRRMVLRGTWKDDYDEELVEC